LAEIRSGNAGIADARADNWVNRLAPARLRPYLRLGRLDRPIGVWLLLWPCYFGVSLAARDAGEAYPDPWLLVLFAVGALLMRAAGCTFNDILDRDIDARIERTRGRPLASGQVSVIGAVVFMVLLSLLGLLVLLQFNGFTIWLGIAVLPLVAIYPLVKRISHWPQAVLGLAFSWGALMGFAAVEGDLPAPALLLYAGCVLWTIGYDTIYAHQDREDDALLGLKSTALRFGAATGRWLILFYGGAWLLITAAGMAADAGIVFLMGMCVAGLHLAWQGTTIDIDDAENCLLRFRSNREFGAIVFVSIVLDAYLAATL
jgi:4-hydroxybenzoate polyprenyltransferase